MKTAVFFPGIGYHTDKPLLYFSKKLSLRYGYEIREVPYTGFPPNIKGDQAKMHAAFEYALSQTEQILSDISWSEPEDILFFSKSIGTVVAAAYASRKEIHPGQVYYTPLKETFRFVEKGNGIVFHGTADPWASDPDIEEGCREKLIPLTQIENANHSLETGDVQTDLANLQRVLQITENWLRERL